MYTAWDKRTQRTYDTRSIRQTQDLQKRAGTHISMLDIVLSRLSYYTQELSMLPTATSSTAAAAVAAAQGDMSSG
jgi:hypothetical protein